MIRLIGCLGLMVLLIGCGSQNATPQTTLAAQDIVGYRVLGTQHEALGKVESVVVDIEDGTIRYIVVAPPTPPRSWEHSALIPVPWGALHLDEESHMLIVDASTEVLRAAPRLDKIPDTRQVGWDKPIAEYWANHLPPQP